MSLAPGTRLGPYEILAPIGAGGMGEVYRARDTRLNREVAIKVSGERFSDRFEREAHSIAALNHPNICTLHDVGPNYLVMELVEGPTLADRIKQGPVPLDEALAIGGQIAEALGAAHEKGIVHRDLKPGNIKIKPDGTVKVLDFGLAKMAEPGGPEGSPESSPTRTFQQATRAGMILGTAAYMAPEQARGKNVDKRADIWAFGVVFYEMLTSRQAFRGETITDVLAAVVKEEPDLTRVPSKVRRLLEACLQKDPKQRLQAIGDWRLLLEDATQVAETRYGARLPWALVTVLIITLLALGYAYFHRPVEAARVFKLFVLAHEGSTFDWRSIPALSPDGRRLAYLATSDGKFALWLRELDSTTARMLPGTEDGGDPFWSPDSGFIGFFAADKLKKIDVSGGSVQTLCDAPFEGGGSWSGKDTILFGARGGLFRVAAAGGSAKPVTSAESGFWHIRPWFLPDGRHYLYTAVNELDPQKATAYVADLDSKDRRSIAAQSNVIFTPPGYLLFVRERVLMAQRFDVDKLRATGDPVPIAEQVRHIPPWAFISASQNGVLVYNSGGLEQLTIFDRTGRVVGTAGPAGRLRWPTISPDGQTAAIDIIDQQTGFCDIWLYDLKRGTASRFTFNSKDNLSAIWSRDGRNIVFSSTREGVGSVYQMATSGAATEKLLDKSSGSPRFPADWSIDGRYIIEGVNESTKAHIEVLPLFGDGKPFRYLHTEFSESNPRLSPNGHWMAYQSDETKRPEVYVQSFPTPGPRYQISTNGGQVPTWSRDGKELFFIEEAFKNPKMMVAEVKSENTTFEASVPKTLFEIPVRTEYGPWFDVSKDGRFFIPIPIKQSSSVPITVVVNWTAGLKK